MTMVHSMLKTCRLWDNNVWRLVVLRRSSGRCCSVSTLSDADRKLALERLSEGAFVPWSESKEGKAIHKTFEFTNFHQAWSFMSRTAVLAEKNDHHPEWFNVYNRVEVTLTTHDCGGVSEKDITMAAAMEDFAREILPPRGPE